MLMAHPTGKTDVSVCELKGGTDAQMAPPVGYAQHVLQPLLKRLLGIEATLEVQCRGFYPRVCAVWKVWGAC